MVEMSPRTFFRACLATPLLVPAPLMAVVLYLEHVGVPVPGALGGFALVLVGSLIVGGVPYFVLAAVACWWMGGKSATSIRRFTWVLPPLFFLVLVLLRVVKHLFTWGLGGALLLGGDLLALAGFVVLVGYAHVLSWHALFVLFRWAGWVRAD